MSEATSTNSAPESEVGSCSPVGSAPLRAPAHSGIDVGPARLSAPAGAVVPEVAVVGHPEDRERGVELGLAQGGERAGGIQRGLEVGRDDLAALAPAYRSAR